MLDAREALKHIKTLADIAAETDDVALLQKHLAMISEVAEKAIKGATPPKKRAASPPNE